MLGHLKQKVIQTKQQHFYPALSKLKGRILEIGFGNGESLDYYPSNCEIFALEKSDKKVKAQNKSLAEHKNVRFFKGEAESMPFENNFFNAVVVSFVLCSVNSLDMAMREIERVLKPYGKFIFLEHVRSENKVIGTIQDILAKPYSRIAKNCHPNRNPLLLLSNDIFDLSIEVQVPYILSKLVFAQAYKKMEVKHVHKSQYPCWKS